MEKLDDRLSTAVSFARKGAVAADIGTDHGYLICELVSKKLSPKVRPPSFRAAKNSSGGGKA